MATTAPTIARVLIPAPRLLRRRWPGGSRRTGSPPTRPRAPRAGTSRRPTREYPCTERRPPSSPVAHAHPATHGPTELVRRAQRRLGARRPDLGAVLLEQPGVLEGARHGDAHLVVHPVGVVDDQPQHAALARRAPSAREGPPRGRASASTRLDTSLQLLLAGGRHRSPLSREIRRAHKKGGFVTHHQAPQSSSFADGMMVALRPPIRPGGRGRATPSAAPRQGSTPGR